MDIVQGNVKVTLLNGANRKVRIRGNPLKVLTSRFLLRIIRPN